MKMQRAGYAPIISFLALLFPDLGKAQVLAPAINQIRFADQFAGADCGAKINAADTDLGTSAGEIWVNTNCGTTWTTAVNLGGSGRGHTLRFIQGGIYSISATITMSGHNAVITASPQSMAANSVSSGFGEQVVLQMANGVNLSSIITATGNFPVIENIQVDGNYTNNPSGGVGIDISGSLRPEINRVTIGNSKTHGLELDNVVSAKIFKLMTYQNRNDGLYCNGSATGGGDGFVSNSEFESNQANGMELSNCPAWRIIQNDFGLNSQGVSGSCGLKIYGTVSGGQANNENININQFGNNFRDDLCIIGYNSGNTSLGNNILGNIFIGSNNLLGANTYNEIKLTDGGQDILNSNTLATSASTSNACGISINETASGRFLPSQTLPNAYASANAWGTSGYCDSTANKSSGFMLPLPGTSSGNVLVISPIAPTVSSGFNTGAAGLSTGTSSFTIVVGTGSAVSTGTISLPQTSNGWNCTLTNQTRADLVLQTASTNNSATFTNYGTTFAATNFTNSDVLLGVCYGR